MKIKPYFILIVLISGCTSALSKLDSDTRPSEELHFVNKLAMWDTVYQAGKNDINRDDALNQGMQDVIEFVDDTLQFKVKNWQAYVNDIKIGDLSYMKYIDVELLIPQSNSLDTEDPEYNSIVLDCQSAYDDNKIKGMLSNLKVGDKVDVTGSFIPGSTSHHIVFRAFDEEKYTFANPKFEFIISNIKKSK